MKIILFLGFFSFPLVFCCPRKEILHPCKCHMPSNSYHSHVVCSSLSNGQELVAATSSLAQFRNIYSFTIKDSSFYLLPYDAFKGVKFTRLEMINTNLMSLTDIDVAFVGLEKHLKILLMTNCTIMTEWDWGVLRNLKALTTFQFRHSNLMEISAEFENINISSLKNISFESNSIQFVHSYAFRHFKRLEVVSLSNNKIEVLRRTMFPRPALELKHIDLSYNQIEQLPEDLFTNMPILENLGMGNNKLLVLNEKTFEPIWEQLKLFNAIGNELRCDCRMLWILEKRSPKTNRAVCAKPQEVKGKSVSSLTSKDLWCFK